MHIYGMEPWTLSVQGFLLTSSARSAKLYGEIPAFRTLAPEGALQGVNTWGGVSKEGGFTAAFLLFFARKYRSVLQWSRFPKEAEGETKKGITMTTRNASMEPLPEGSGRPPIPHFKRVILPVLQWSRFPKEAEGCLNFWHWMPSTLCFNGAASRRKRKAG